MLSCSECCAARESRHARRVHELTALLTCSCSCSSSLTPLPPECARTLSLTLSPSRAGVAYIIVAVGSKLWVGLGEGGVSVEMCSLDANTPGGAVP